MLKGSIVSVRHCLMHREHLWGVFAPLQAGYLTNNYLIYAVVMTTTLQKADCGAQKAGKLSQAASCCIALK
jgi:hypothetical protein